MTNARQKAINVIIQAVFLSIVGLLMIVGGVMLWSVGTAPAYIGAASVFVIGLAVLWWLVLQPLLNLRKPAAADKRSSKDIPAQFDENPLMTWAFALGGGVFLLVSAVLVAAVASGHGPSGTFTLKMGLLIGLVIVIDVMGLWGW